MKRKLFFLFYFFLFFEFSESKGTQKNEITINSDPLILADNDLKKFKQISTDFKRLDRVFRICINTIPKINYNEETVVECVGQNFSKFINFVNYEVMKL